MRSMIGLNGQIRLTRALDILSLFAGVTAHLALTYIYHAEGSLTLE